MKKRTVNSAAVLTIMLLSALILSGCPADSDDAVRTEGDKQEKQLYIFTSILPQVYFVKRIAADRVKAEALVGPGQSPATYEPSPGQVTDLSTADVLFTIGVPFEAAFLPKITRSLASLLIEDTAAGIEKRMLEEHEHEETGEHAETDDHENEEGTPDPHVWLSPLLVKEQAAVIKETLVEIDPAHKDKYEQGYQDFLTDLDSIHKEIEQMLAPLKGRTLLVFHPSFGYFTDAYGLRQRAVELGGKSPSPADLEKIISAAKEEGVKTVFVQPEFSRKSAEVIADAIDGSVVVLNPLQPDYIENLRNIAEKILEAFGSRTHTRGTE